VTLPYCTPSASPGTLPGGATCCRDFECASNQCFGWRGNRTCALPAAAAQQGQPCGDETDCAPEEPLVCDIINDAGTCVGSFLPLLGEGNACTPGVPMPGMNHTCTFAPAGSCGLPGALSDRNTNNNPCCYDRWPDGGLADCRVVTRDGGAGTGSCWCELPPMMGCGSDANGYVCPF